QPLPIRLHFLAGENRRQGARDPPRLQGVGRVHPGTYLSEPELLASLDDRGLDRRTYLPRAEQLQARYARHAVVQRPHPMATDVDTTHVEELDFRQGSSVQLLQKLHRVGALNLITVALAAPGGVGHGALVPFQRDVVAARFRV